jgi:hypothetical protein
MDMDMDDDKDDSNPAAKTQWGNIFSGAKKALDEMTTLSTNPNLKSFEPPPPPLSPSIRL